MGAGIGTRACALVICVHLYRITRFRELAETAKQVCTSVNVQLYYSVGSRLPTDTEAQNYDLRTSSDSWAPSPRHGTLYVILCPFARLYY